MEYFNKYYYICTFSILALCGVLCINVYFEGEKKHCKLQI